MTVPLSKVEYVDATTGKVLFSRLFFGTPNEWCCGEFISHVPVNLEDLNDSTEKEA